jgi:hypothetical protein
VHMYVSKTFNYETPVCKIYFFPYLSISFNSNAFFFNILSEYEINFRNHVNTRIDICIGLISVTEIRMPLVLPLAC